MFLSQRRQPIRRLPADPLSPSKAGNGNLKRPRSPDSSFAPFQQLKRPKASTAPQPLRAPEKPAASSTSRFQQHLQNKTRDPEKRALRETRRREKQEQDEEFARKYSAAFCQWTFFFDDDHLRGVDVGPLKDAIEGMGGVINNGFYQKIGISHFISNCPREPAHTPSDDGPEKENTLQSPFKLHANPSGQSLLNQALSFGHKVWTSDKLSNVLQRCGAFDVPHTSRRSKATSLQLATPSRPKQQQRSLKLQLDDERVNGTTERDPKQKRHDYKYFTKNSYFLLVEDLRNQLAPIIFQDYGPYKDVEDEKAKPPWPKLFCHNKSRNPFQPFDDREKHRYEKSKKLDKEVAQNREWERERFIRAAKKRIEQESQHQHGGGDLRRTVSLSHMSHRAAEEAVLDRDADASGYLASGNNYVAASGNSVGITSTTGTTSATIRTRDSLPVSLRGGKEFIMSRKSYPPPVEGAMGPPAFIPEKSLRKTKSTNSVRLPKREEGSKPGYCESCRQKFNDFDTHTASSRHRNFAKSNTNFVALDLLLGRVARKTKAEVEEERQKRWLVRQDMLRPQSEEVEMDSPQTPLQYPSSDDDFGAWLGRA